MTSEWWWSTISTTILPSQGWTKIKFSYSILIHFEEEKWWEITKNMNMRTLLDFNTWCREENWCPILWPLRVTSIKIFLNNITPESIIKITRIAVKIITNWRAVDHWTNSPCQHLRKCIENGMETMQSIMI